MTLGTNCRSLGRAECLESDDFGDVASPINMRLAGSMAGLTSVLTSFQEGRMWGSGKVFVPHFLVTGFADIGFRVLAAAGPRQGCRILDRLIRRLFTLAYRSPSQNPDRRQGNKEAGSSACSQVHWTCAPYDLFGGYSRMNLLPKE